MEWRCTFCGKPHAEDDPPCDNCGHNKFERAVEQFDATAAPTDPIWVCTECGRKHQKNSPPCSRCGNVDLEKRQPDYDLDELEGTSYLDVLEPRYAAGYVAVAVLGGVLLLAFAGVISLPTLGGPPAPPDVPGNDTAVGDLSLDEAATEYVDAVNAGRERDGNGALDEASELVGLASYANARAVADRGESGGPDTAAYVEDYGLECEAGDVTYPPTVEQYDVGFGDGVDPRAHDGAATYAASLLDAAPQPVREEASEPIHDAVGVDVHVLDERVYVSVALC